MHLTKLEISQNFTIILKFRYNSAPISPFLSLLYKKKETRGNNNEKTMKNERK